MRNSLILSLLMTFVLAGLSAQNFNMVVNGEFNGNPSTTGWETEVVDKPVANQTTGGNPGGYVWLNHNGGGNDPGVSQMVSGFKAGNEYIITGLYRGGDQADTYCKCPGKEVFAVDIDGNQLETFAMPEVATDWVRFSVSFTARADAHKIRFRGEINGSDGDIAIDNIAVQSAMSGWFRLKTMFRGEGESLEGNRAGSDVKDGAAFMNSQQNVSGQYWRFEPAGDGYYRLKTMFRGNQECLESNQSSSSVHGGAAFMDKEQNVSGQYWKLEPAQQGFYRLKSMFRGEGECLEGNQASSSVHQGAAFMDKEQNVSGQLWKLERVNFQ